MTSSSSLSFGRAALPFLFVFFSSVLAGVDSPSSISMSTGSQLGASGALAGSLGTPILRRGLREYVAAAEGFFVRGKSGVDAVVSPMNTISAWETTRFR